MPQNLTKKHPVVIIPGNGRAAPRHEIVVHTLCRLRRGARATGIVSTGLEMWKGKRCAPRFRERLWGESIMFRKLLLNPKCWLEHLALNATTGTLLPRMRSCVCLQREGSCLLVPSVSQVWTRMVSKYGQQVGTTPRITSWVATRCGDLSSRTLLSSATTTTLCTPDALRVAVVVGVGTKGLCHPACVA